MQSAPWDTTTGPGASRLRWPRAPSTEGRKADSRRIPGRTSMASLPTPSADSRTRAAALREALASRVVVADGAMGTMLQAQDPTLEDFQNLEGCNEILNITRPDIVRSVHEEYFAVGVDCVETNTFGANHSAANEYEIADRIVELSESGARIAREVADEFAAKDGRQRWVLGSIGPGTKLPSLGHITYDVLR